MHQKQIVIEPVRMDSVNECLWRGPRAVKLRPKAFALLNHLRGRSGQLVTKKELLDTVWPETFVSDAVLKGTISELREALEDDSRSPRFIETAHRRGYRFIGQIADVVAAHAHRRRVRDLRVVPPAADHSTQAVVGREAALTRMRSWFEKVIGGERQVVFITGEAGIGKTALVDTFCDSIASDESVLIARGQCLEQYGTGEAYLPFLGSIARLCREHEEVVEVLRAHAPTWLLQMPSLMNASNREALNRGMFGATRERMLREMSEALEALTANQPLVLILEDLHWGDFSTLDLISYLARQRHPAHLMLIGTYRTVELIMSGHPLKAVKQELVAKQQAEELPLQCLSEGSVANYLSSRFPSNRFPPGLAGLIFGRTDGNPLFMVNAVDYLLAEGLIVEHQKCWELVVEIEKVEVGVPDSIKQMIEKQVDRLDVDQQRTLEAASVVGAEFSSLAVVAGLEEDRELVEARCDELARQNQFIQHRGIQELPDGELVTRYGFIHSLYRSVLYERASAFRRAQLHRRIGERGEQVYGERNREIAAELAMHFELGRDYKRAAEYLRFAAENDIRRFAYREAVGVSRRALELLKRLPRTPERAQQELNLQLMLGLPLIATEGYAAPDVGSVYSRARDLCLQLGEMPDVSEVLWGLWGFYIVRAELAAAHEIAEELLRLAERLPYPVIAMLGHLAMEVTCLHLGQFDRALDHFEKALSLYDPEKHLKDTFYCSQNPGVAMRCHAGWALWFLGQPDQALDRMQEALTLARELSEPHGLAHASYFAAILHHERREDQLAREHAEEALAISSEHGLVMYQAMARIALGWSMNKQGHHDEAIEQMRQGLAVLESSSAEIERPHFLALLARSLAEARRVGEAFDALDQAFELAHRRGEACYLAELYRIKGELFLAQAAALSGADTHVQQALESEPSAVTQAEACFHQSIEIAQQQSAKSLELRAVMSTARLFQKQGKLEEARDLLGQVFDKFTEGFQTPDLREARALLDQLSLSGPT